MLKGQKGITLVALVITIIILLILAGVTISLTLGDNGLFKTAQGAAKNYSDAAQQEQNLVDDAGKVVENLTTQYNIK